MNAKERNIKISDHIHYAIPKVVRDIVEGHLQSNEELKCMHNREVLDDIIHDLKVYRRNLPSVADLEACNVL